jgi:hypothetical protein
MRSSVFIALAASFFLACSGEEGTCETGCMGECEVGNEFGIGHYCTVGGGECGDTPARQAPFCTVDFQEDAIAFCTRPCNPDGNVLEECGANAMCLSDEPGGQYGCVPNFCM